MTFFRTSIMARRLVFGLACVVGLMAALVGEGRAAFDPPGLSADAGRYLAQLRATIAPQPNKERRQETLNQAKSALSARDWSRAIMIMERAISEGEDRASIWLTLSKTWLMASPPNPTKALHAAFLSYRSAQTPADSAQALQRLSQLLEDSDHFDQALAAMQEIKGLKEIGGVVSQEEVERRISALVVKVGLTFRGFKVQEDNDPPRICLEFSGKLQVANGGEAGQSGAAPRPTVRYEDYVRLDPPVPTLAAEPHDDTLCLSGVANGASYQVAIRQGFPSADPQLSVRRDETLRVRVGDRSPSVAFRGQSFILPRGNSDGLPVTTVNVDVVAVKVFRINDRNLVPSRHRDNKPMTELGSYEIDNIADRDGELIWQGKMDIKGERNRPVTTGLPIRSVLGDSKPGLYVVTAELVDVNERHVPYRKATQWVMVSDLGLTVMRGADGVNVFVRSFGSAKPLAGVSVVLVARNNNELARVVTDAEGKASFSPGLARGAGGQTPEIITAYGNDGDFATLDLTAAAFDLSDRGVGGRQTPGPLDVYLYSDRGVYRPGETVALTALLRDPKISAVDSTPLTLKVYRPGGAEYRSSLLQPGPAGGFVASVSLTRSAPMGAWSAQIFSDPKAAPIGRLTFQVEDFIPEKLAVDMTPGAETLAPGQPFEILVKARFLYGPSAAGLGGKAEASLQPDPDPYPAHRGFSFGLAQENVTPRIESLEFSNTDAMGESRLSVTLPPLPDTTRPLRAEVRVAVSEPGGRPTRKSITVPVRAQPYAVGIRPKFEGARLEEGQEPAFELIAVDPEGRRIDKANLSYALYAEHHDFQWFLEEGRYNYRLTLRDESLRGGVMSLSAQGVPATQTFGALPYGRYRLEVFDKTTRVATSFRFSSGWEVAPQVGDTPDQVEVVADKAAYVVGEKAKIRISPPFAGEVLLTVATDKVLMSRALSVPAKGATVEIPVSSDWGPGAYVTATVYRPPVRGKDRLPVRAIGLTWVAVDAAARTLSLAIEAPEVVRPRQTIEVPIRVSVAGGAPAKDAYVTLAAVDEGILQLTNFVSPDPGKHYFGKRALGLDIRDDYGRLIDTIDGSTGVLRQGGDAGGGKGLPTVPVVILSLFQGPVKVDADGSARIRLTLPDFTGQARLMAVAWDRERVGSGVGSMTIRDPLVADVTLPRFLAPGDDSRVAISLHNVEGEAGTWSVVVNAKGAVAVPFGQDRYSVALERNARQMLVVPLQGASVGLGSVTVVVNGPGVQVSHQFGIAVRSGRPVETTFITRQIEPGLTVDVGASALAGYVPGSAGLTVSWSSAPPFDVGGLVKALDRYPYGCLEQITSRALPLLALNDVEQALGVERSLVEAESNTLEARVDKAIAQILDKQRYDGAFSVWSARGEEHLWLSAYAMEFLVRARAKGRAVPEAPYIAGLTALRRHAIDGGDTPPYLASRSYALHVLALAGVLTPGPARYFSDAFLDHLPSPLSKGQLAAALARLGDRERAQTAANAALAQLARDPWYEDYGSTVRDAAALITTLGEVDLLSNVSLPNVNSVPNVGAPVGATNVPTEGSAGGWPVNKPPKPVLAGPGGAGLAALVDRLPANEISVAQTSTQEQAWLTLAASTLMKGAAPVALSVAGRPTVLRGEAIHLTPSSVELAQGLRMSNAGAKPVWESVAVYGAPSQPVVAAREGFKIKRGFFQRDGAPLNLDLVRQNDVFVITIEGEANTKLYHQALISHLLPAGWEIENRALGAGGVQELAWLTELTDTVMAEARDDRYVAAVNLSQDSAKFKLAFIVRAVTPGSYELPGAQVEDMYKPRFFARQAMGRITVLPAE
ncbi:alpha-2-macroglobulin [Azospirillaceae bacterium]